MFLTMMEGKTVTARIFRTRGGYDVTLAMDRRVALQARRFRRIHLLNTPMTREHAVELLVGLELDPGQERFTIQDFEMFKAGHVGFWYLDLQGKRIEVLWDELTNDEVARLVAPARERVVEE
jgi:hypothetical protein